MIIKTRIELPLNKYRYEYTWEGDSDYINLGAIDLAYECGTSAEEVKVGDVIQWGPYSIRIIDTNRPILGVRRNWLNIPRLYSRVTARLFDNFYRKFILTLYIWGFARWNEERIPSWRDIKIFKKK